jgi:hypothetical protein
VQARSFGAGQYDEAGATTQPTEQFTPLYNAEPEVTMTTSPRVLATALVVAVTLALSSEITRAQVTTATLYGVVQDSSGAILPV